MIGTQRTGAIEGVVISAVAHEGLTVLVDGKPACLAIISDDGQVIASGREVAREARAVAINCYRNFLKGEGWLRTYSKPIEQGDHALGEPPKVDVRQVLCDATDQMSNVLRATAGLEDQTIAEAVGNVKTAIAALRLLLEAQPAGRPRSSSEPLRRKTKSQRVPDTGAAT